MWYTSRVYVYNEHEVFLFHVGSFQFSLRCEKLNYVLHAITNTMLRLLRRSGSLCYYVGHNILRYTQLCRVSNSYNYWYETDNNDIRYWRESYGANSRMELLNTFTFTCTPRNIYQRHCDAIQNITVIRDCVGQMDAAKKVEHDCRNIVCMAMRYQK